MKCPNCGTENQNTKFCINCGNKLVSNIVEQNGVSVMNNNENVDPVSNSIIPENNTQVEIAQTLNNAIESDTLNVNESQDSVVENIIPENVENLNSMAQSNNKNITESQNSNGEKINMDNVDDNRNNELSINPIQSSNSGVEEITISQIDNNNNNNANVVTPNISDNEKADYDFYDKPKKKWPIILIVILVLILAIVGGFIYFMSSPKNNFKLNLYKYYYKFSNNMEEKITSTTGEFYFDTNINTNNSNDNAYLNIVNKFTLSSTYAIDYSNKVLNVDIGTNYGDNELLKGNIYTENSKVYLFLDNIFDKYISSTIDEKTYNKIFDLADADDSKKILNSIKNAVDKSLKDEYFSKESTTINVNGKSISVNKNIFSLKGSQIDDFSKSILTILKNDAEFVTSYKNMTDEDITKTINEVLEDSPKTSDDISIKFNMYTKPYIGSVLKFDVELSNESNTYKIEVTKDSDTKYTILVTVDSLATTIVLNTSKENNLNVYKFDITNINMDVDITLKYNYSYNKTVNKEDVSNYVEYEKMTEDDINSIYAKLSSLPGVKELITDVGSLSGGVSSMDEKSDNGKIETNYDINF